MLLFLLFLVNLLACDAQRATKKIEDDYDYEFKVDYDIRPFSPSLAGAVPSTVPGTTGARPLSDRKNPNKPPTIFDPQIPNDVELNLFSSSSSKGGEEPCYRECSRNKRTAKRCEFNFKLEYYITNSSQCSNCSASNLASCSQSGCIVADGVRRSINIVNGMMPGPPIRVCEGDTVVVRVENNLDEPTSIHWHGIHQKGTPFYDGVPQITQCPILPRTTFTYEFETPLAGTYFWHSHSGFQRADGLYGSLIVRKDPRSELYGPKGNNKLYDFDRPEDELLIMDWQERFTRDVYLDSKHANDDFRPRNILINGKGARRGHFANDAVDGPSTPPNTPIQEIVIERNKGYRLRLISNGIMSCPIQISIDSHNMTVIASDGFDVRPLQVNTVVIYPGERWDVVIRGDQVPGIYWIKFHGVNVCTGVNGPNTFQVAILKYEEVSRGIDTKDNLPNQPVRSWQQAGPPRNGTIINPFVCRSVKEEGCVQVSELRNVEDDDPEILIAKPNHTFYLSSDFNPVDSFNRSSLHKPGHVAFINGSSYTPQIDHITFVPPKISLLTQPQDHHLIYNCSHGRNGKFFSSRKLGLEPIDGGEGVEEQSNEDTNCRDQLCACVHIIKVKLNSIVEVIMIDEGKPLNASHPFHLHGHSFRVIGMGQVNQTGITVEQIKQLDNQGRGLDRLRINAPIKDTINVPDGGYTIFRFRANNPGFWYYHCHVEFHVEGGMGLVFQVGEVNQMSSTPSNFPTCGKEKPLSKPIINIGDLEDTPSIYYDNRDGRHYWPFTRPSHDNSIYIRSSKSATDWSLAPDKKVFTFPSSSSSSFSSAPLGIIIGQPKLHKLNGEFYLYFHVASSDWPTTRLFAVKSNGGPNSAADFHYGEPKRLIPQNADGNWGRPESPTVLEMNNGQLYLIWSDIVTRGPTTSFHVLTMAKLRNPTQIDGQSWVVRGHQNSNLAIDSSLSTRSGNGVNVNRSPQVFSEGNKNFLIFSAIDKESKAYCVGMMEIQIDRNPLVSTNWKKYDPNCAIGNSGLDRVYLVNSAQAKSSAKQDDWLIDVRQENLFTFRNGFSPVQKLRKN